MTAHRLTLSALAILLSLTTIVLAADTAPISECDKPGNTANEDLSLCKIIKITVDRDNDVSTPERPTPTNNDMHFVPKGISQEEFNRAPWATVTCEDGRVFTQCKMLPGWRTWCANDQRPAKCR